MNSREKWAELKEDKDFNPYKSISKQGDYNRLLLSGHFFDIHPELTGNWKVDRLRILADEFEERMNLVGQNGNTGLHYDDSGLNYENPTPLYDTRNTTGGVSFQFWEDQDFSTTPKDPNQTTLNI